MSDHHNNLPAIDRRIGAAADEGCEESKFLISRRAALGLSAGFFTWAYMPRIAEASGRDPRLLIVMLRGGMDGLNVIVPNRDPDYLAVRQRAALTGGLLTLDSFFSLHPALKNFKALYDKGEASAIHAIAPPLRIRSHFECQRNIEMGEPDGPQTLTGGWLNRLLAHMSPGDPVRAGGGALQIGPTPLILQGSEKVLSWSPSLWPRPPGFDDRVLSPYSATDPLLYALLRKGIDANKNAVSADGISLPASPTNLQRSFRGAARLLSSPTEGARIAVLNVEGWDTHVDQTVNLSNNLADLDNSLLDFNKIATANNFWDETVVLFVTEFGRTAKGNGTGGTDHGVGTVALMAGGAVSGGKVVADWPGLKNLVDGRDLRPTYDLRQLFKAVLRDHLQVSDTNLLDATLFRASAGVRPIDGLIKG